MTTNYKVNNVNYDNKDLSDIFLPSPSPYFIRYFLEQEFTSSSIANSGWTRSGSGSGGTIPGTVENPGQYELLTNSGNGVSIVYHDISTEIIKQNMKITCIIEADQNFTGDNQQVYAGISTSIEPPTKNSAKNVYIGIVPTTGGSGQIVFPTFVGFINNNSSTSTPTPGSNVAIFETVWEPNKWYYLEITINISSISGSIGSGTVTFTVKNLTDRTSESISVNSSNIIELGIDYKLLVEQRIDSTTKYFHVDYMDYDNSYQLTRTS